MPSSPGGSARSSVGSSAVGETLESAISADATVALGPIKVPLGAFITMVSRLLRGPYLGCGLYEAPGTTSLVAELRSPAGARAWRIDRTAPADAGEMIKE